MLRLQWRPSRRHAAILLAMGVLASLSVLASDLAFRFALPAALAAAGWGAWLARREIRRGPHGVIIDSEGIRIDGETATGFQLEWRGPLAFARWRDNATGKTRRLVWWPDTLPPAARRELRLALPVEKPPRRARSMAT